MVWCTEIMMANEEQSAASCCQSAVGGKPTVQCSMCVPLQELFALAYLHSLNYSLKSWSFEILQADWSLADLELKPTLSGNASGARRRSNMNHLSHFWTLCFDNLMIIFTGLQKLLKSLAIIFWFAKAIPYTCLPFRPFMIKWVICIWILGLS